MATPATQIAAGDLDGDGIDDLLGIWPGQGGVWVKYSSANNWARLSSTADWIGCGKMRSDESGASGAMELAEPVGGTGEGPSLFGDYDDLSSYGPWGFEFKYTEDKNIWVGLQIDGERQDIMNPGPGEPGFKCTEQKNLVPEEGLKIKRDNKKK